MDGDVHALGVRDKQARAPGEGVGSPQVHTAGPVGRTGERLGPEAAQIWGPHCRHSRRLHSGDRQPRNHAHLADTDLEAKLPTGLTRRGAGTGLMIRFQALPLHCPPGRGCPPGPPPAWHSRPQWSLLLKPPCPVILRQRNREAWSPGRQACRQGQGGHVLPGPPCCPSPAPARKPE